jgi:glycerophosphoryl diester phosphodiesterase
LISDAKKRNLLIHVWTINNPNEMEELIDMGIDGIVTDEPDILMNVIKNRNLLEI